MKIKTLLIIFVGLFLIVLTGCNGSNKEIKNVIEKINSLPEVVTLEDETKIVETRIVYDKLSENDKKKVDNINKLIEKENTLRSLIDAKSKEVNDLAKAAAVIKMITDLPEIITLDHEDLLTNVKNAYEALSVEQKPLVSNKSLLDAKFEGLNKLKNDKLKEDVDKLAASTVEKMISDLPETIALDHEELLTNVKNAFEALTLEQKALVTNKSLFDTKFEELSNLKIDIAAAEAVDNIIINLPSKIDYTHKDKIDEVNALYNALTDVQKSYLKNKEMLEQKVSQYNKSIIDKNKANQVDELILSIPEMITVEDVELIINIKKQYDNLTIDQKALIVNLDKLNSAIDYAETIDESYNISLINNFIKEMSEEVYKEDEATYNYIFNKYNSLSSVSKSKIEGFDLFYNNFIKVRVKVIEAWAKNHIGQYVMMEVNFINIDPIYGYQLNWSSSDEYLIDQDGYAYPEEEDIPLTIYCDVLIEGEVYRINIDTLLIAEKYTFAAEDFYSQFKNPIGRDYSVSTNSKMYPDAIITWRSLNEEIFTNEGKLIKPGKNSDFEIEIVIAFPDDNNPKTFTRTFTALGLSMSEKADIIEAWIYENVGNNRVINGNVEFPTYFEKYDISLSWVSSDPNILTTDGVFNNPGIDSAVNMIITITSGEDKGVMEVRFVLAGTRYEDKWDAVNMLFNYITLDEINNFEMWMYGASRTDISQNYGYLPFYTNTRSEIIEGIVDRSLTQTRPGTKRPGTKYITIHDTANVNADAKAHNDYINSGKAVNVSWHYTVDDREIYNHIPNDEVAWHAGNTTSGLYSGNSYSIGIETSIHLGVDYNQVMRNTAKLTAELLVEYGLTIDDVKQHYDFSRKDCPHVMRAAGRWNEFLNLVKIEYFAILNLSGVEFVWESLSPEIMDNTGKIIGHPGQAREIVYKAKVTVEGVTKEFTFTSTVKQLTFIPRV